MGENDAASPVSARSKSSHTIWALAVVVAVVMLLIGFLAYRAMAIPGDAIDKLGRAFAPHTDYRTETTSAIRELKNNPKLVVLTAVLDAEVHKSSSTSALWIYWGTTTVDVRARENKVQFYVPLDDVGTANFEYDDVHKILTVRIKPPILDEDVVDVQTDPNKVDIKTSNGWSKLDHFSGAPMREEALHELRSDVIQAAKQPAQYELLQLQAKANAKEHIRTLLAPLASTLKPDVKLEIEFTGGR